MPLEATGPPRQMRKADRNTARARRAGEGRRGRGPGPTRTEPGRRPAAWDWDMSLKLPRWPEGSVGTCREAQVGEPRPGAHSRHHLSSRMRETARKGPS